MSSHDRAIRRMYLIAHLAAGKRPLQARRAARAEFNAPLPF